MFTRRLLVGLIVVGVFLLAGVSAQAQDYERIITRAYEDILGRQPDKEGMRHFRSRMIDERWDEARVRAALRDSDEYRLRQIDVVINRAYDDLLRRKPDRHGQETYRRKMLREGWDEQRVRQDIMNSDEYRRRR
ncbi:hypothetical protein [Desulfonatronum sp. SC1]|uniref:hypothetical protein n=1 Tax=Desulfonatronum sp. SC1 TaxID=2109626 RepID=UPI000D32572B|nr:hypothetical protein [Desulfonatronum sp. SC1]PTN31543.1 hypothetical protein C6366_18035 [Desulfonatronum sp. SC1]